MTAYIGYSNLLEADGATVTSGNSVGVTDSSSETDAGPVENCFDWNTHDFWIPAFAGSYSVKVDLGSGNDAQPDYLAIAAHNLGSDTTGFINLYSSDINATSVTGNPATGWVLEWFTSSPTPDSNRPWLWKFTTTDNDTRRYWLVRVSTETITSQIGCLSFGTALALPYPPPVGFAPIHWQQSETKINSISEGGAFLGRQVVREGYRGSIPIQFATRTWMDNNWNNFIAHALIKPFWYTFDYENQPDEVVFCWLEGSQSWPRYVTPDVFNALLNVRALYL